MDICCRCTFECEPTTYVTEIGPTSHFKHFIFVQKKEKIEFHYRISVSYVILHEHFTFTFKYFENMHINI